MSVLDDIPAGAIPAVMVLVKAIVQVIMAGDDDAAREEALMTAAEGVKRQLDALKFGR